MTSNAQDIYPELPIGRRSLLIEDGRRQLNGTLRTAFRAEKVAMSYGRSDLTEAERTTWIAAHPRNTSFTHTDEFGASRTMKVVSFDIPLERTEPDVEGGTNTTGAGYYRVAVELEEV